MSRYALIVVEGRHDRAFVGRLLRGLGFTSFKERPSRGKASRLDPFWDIWRPTYPKHGNLYAPLDMPEIWEHADWSVAVHAAGGSEILSTVPTFLETIPDWLASLTASRGAFGIIADSDKELPSAVYSKLAECYLGVLGGLPGQAGAVRAGPPRVGAFSFPDNLAEGTVESVLIPVGRENLGSLLTHADTFVDGCEPELKAHFAPFDHLKARVAAAASILQPGSTNTVTIEKDPWITADQLHHPALAPFVRFLCGLLELPVPAAPTQPDPVEAALDIIHGSP